MKLRAIGREGLERNGPPQCGCGGQLAPICLEVAARCPGEFGERAWAELMGRHAVSGVAADNGRKGAGIANARRKARAAVARGEIKAPRVRSAALASDIPF